MATLTIGRLARRAGLSVETLRFYERSGLLPEPPRNGAGYRSYALEDADRLKFIRRVKELGFSLEDIAELLKLGTAGGNRAEVKAMAERAYKIWIIGFLNWSRCAPLCMPIRVAARGKVP